ncbi:MAG: amino acid ABC transporter substrate-binding protein [Gammaproteobacteria bacterium]|nr:amino acid ABC transporter substrate-binding protein [Gammaproteobacteria bacterium]
MEILFRPARSSGLPGYLLTLVLLISPVPIFADDQVTFCFSDWPPYAEMTDGVVDGITVRIIRKAAQLIGQEISFVQHEWNECLEKVKQGELDVILDASSRPTYLQGPTSFNSYVDTFWVSNKSKISSYDRLSGSRVALVTGYNYDDRLHGHLKHLDAEVVRGRDDPTILRDLDQGMVDAVVADLASTFLFTQKNNLRIHPILPPFTADPLYTSFNREKVELQSNFDQAFARLIEQGFVDEVYEEFYGTTFSSFAAGE